MVLVAYHILFLILSMYILIYTISYGLNEIKKENNQFGGILVILLSIFSAIFSNVLVWII